MISTLNPDGSITLRQDGEQTLPDGTKVACTRAIDIPQEQIFAHARDPEIYDALPAEIRAGIDRVREQLAKVKA